MQIKGIIMEKQSVKDPYDVELDEYEQELEDNFHLQKPLPPKERERVMKMLVSAAKNYFKDSTNVPIPNPDMLKIQNKARELGIPYNKFIIDTLRKAC
jgi:predicted DNA binding CopG/RHH family protein